MPLLASLADIRDGFIIVYGVLGIIFFFIASIVALVLGLTARSLLRSARAVLNDSVKPAAESIHDAVDTVRGTTEFVGKTTVAPIARAYGIFAGVRKGLGILGGLSRRKGD